MRTTRPAPQTGELVSPTGVVDASEDVVDHAVVEAIGDALSIQPVAAMGTDLQGHQEPRQEAREPAPQQGIAEL
jgi:hypothetical protein